jgi:hypothetical protein
MANFQGGQTFLELFGANIRHRNEFRFAGGAQGLASGAGAPAAAADQRDFDRVIAGGGEDGALEGERAAENGGAGTFQEGAPIELRFRNCFGEGIR